jgi:hypothetical protein
MRLSAVLFVEDVLVAELSEGTEFHADCLAQGLCGELFPIQIYDGSNEIQQIDRLKGMLRPGNLLTVHDEVVDVCGNALRLMGPDLVLFEGDSEGLRRGFVRQRANRNQEHAETSTGGVDHAHGQVTECRILATKNAGPMAIATVETADGVVEAVLFPSIYDRYQSVVSRLGVLKFFGKLDAEKDASTPRKIMVEHISHL